MVAADAASLADAGMLFPRFRGTLRRHMFGYIVMVCSTWTQSQTLSLPVQDGTLSPTDPAGILFPVVPAGIPIPPDPAGILFPADLAEPDTVGLADVAVAGVAPLAVPDVFAGPELVAIIVVDEVETVDGIPVDYGGDYDDSDYKNPRNEFETVDGMPVYYGGEFNDSDCEDPCDIDYEEWVD